MLSNLVIGSEKFIFFIDNNAYEPIAQKLFENLVDRTTLIHRPRPKNLRLTENRNSIDIEQEIFEIPDKSNVAVTPISALLLQYTVPDIVKLIHSLKTCSKTKQIFAWANVKNMPDRKVIPLLEHMADVVVTLKDAKFLSILTKRNTGSVSRKDYQYEIAKNLSIIVREQKKIGNENTSVEPTVDPESLATFKINFGEGEVAARNALKLPYERTSKSEEKLDPQIHYQPDSVDDFDEEDPDEDLYI